MSKEIQNLSQLNDNLRKEKEEETNKLIKMINVMTE